MSRRTSSRLSFALATFVALASSPSGAHARLNPSKTLKPRSADSNLKSGPCGNVAPTTTRTTYAPGEMVTIEWEETINHPGWYRIAFSPSGDTGFDANVLKDNITDTQNGSVTYSDPSTFHKYSTTVTLPETLCESCTLQLIQVMTDRNPPTNYYSCADIRIVEGGADAGGETDGAAETPDTPGEGASDEALPDAPTNLQIKVRALKAALTGGEHYVSP